MTNLTDVTVDSFAIGSTTVAFPTVQVINTTGAASIKHGIIAIGGGGATTVTIAPPTVTTDDGKILTCIAVSAQAHLVVVTEGFAAGGAGLDTATMNAIGDSITLLAYNAHWYVIGTNSLVSIG
jgi:hypothetical protein